jgi:hypothetical protein
MEHQVGCEHGDEVGRRLSSRRACYRRCSLAMSATAQTTSDTVADTDLARVSPLASAYVPGLRAPWSNISLAGGWDPCQPLQHANVAVASARASARTHTGAVLSAAHRTRPDVNTPLSRAAMTTTARQPRSTGQTSNEISPWSVTRRPDLAAPCNPER